MRKLVTVLMLLALLGAYGSALVVAGDIGPGENGVWPAQQIAGDIGPGENG